MELSVIKKAETLEVKITGTNKVYVLNQEKIRDEINWLLSIDHKRAILDLDAIQFIDASGIKLLLEVKSRYESLNKKLVLKNITSGANKIMELMGMDNVFIIERKKEVELAAA